MTGNGSPDDDLNFEETIQIPRFAPTQKIFRRYTLQKILGRGGMGVVWLAMDDQLETLVALKVLPDALCHDRASLEALKRETKLGLRLAHPHIVRIYDFQQDDNAAAISMEYVDGVTLSEARSENPAHVFSPSDLQPYVSALCDALNYAHTRRKIVHRDLKPRNLMLDSEGELKIADFGISRSISESMMTVTGKLGSTGSPPYISPQQWDGEQPSPLDDIYSVGATLYELLTSKPPLLGVVDWHQVHYCIPPPMWRRRRDAGITGVETIPPEWEETIAACLAKDPKDRPQTILEVQAQLAAASFCSRLRQHYSLDEDSVGEEMGAQDFSDTTIVVPQVPSPPGPEVPAAPLVDPKVTMPAVPLVDSKLTKPAPPFIEPKEETPAAKAMPSGIEEFPVQAKAEPPLVEVKVEPALAKAEPPLTKDEPPLALPLTEESPSTPAQESLSISPTAPPLEEVVATPHGEDLFDDTIVIQRVPCPPELEVPAEPLVDSKLTKPTPSFIEPKEETPIAKAMPSEIEELPVQAKAEPPLVELKAEPPLALPSTEESPSTPAQELLSISSPAPSPEELVATPHEEDVFDHTIVSPRVPSSPELEMPAAPLVDPKLTMPAVPLVDSELTLPASPLIEPKKETPAAKAMSSEIEELQAKAEPPLVELKAEPSLALPLSEESLSTPAQESRAISPPASSPPAESVATPREEVFPEIAARPVPQREVSYPSPRKLPRWIWVAAGAAIFVLCGSFFIWRKQSPPAVTSSVVQSSHVQSTPNITGFTLDIDSVGKSPDGKQIFPKHVRAFINGTAVKLKGDDNHWSVDFGAKMPPLPFDLEMSAPGYRSAVLHIEHVDDLKNPRPLRLDRERGSIAFRPSGTADFTAAQLKMVEALPGQNEDVVVDSSTIVQDLSVTTPVVLPTGVYQVTFQYGNRNAVKSTMRVAVKAGTLQPVDVPKPAPAVAAEPRPHPTNPPVSVSTTNETPPLANNPPKAVTAARETPAPPAAIPSPAVAIARETPPSANIPPAPTTAPKESPSSANVPPTPAYAVKKSPASERASSPAAKTERPRTNEKTVNSTNRKAKKVPEPTRTELSSRSQAAPSKPSKTPPRKKAAQPFEGGVPGG